MIDQATRAVRLAAAERRTYRVEDRSFSTAEPGETLAEEPLEARPVNSPGVTRNF